MASVDAFGRVSVIVHGREVTLADMRRLVKLSEGLSDSAWFDLSPHGDGTSYTISFNENVETGVGS